MCVFDTMSSCERAREAAPADSVRYSAQGRAVNGCSSRFACKDDMGIQNSPGKGRIRVKERATWRMGACPPRVAAAATVPRAVAVMMDAPYGTVPGH